MHPCAQRPTCILKGSALLHNNNHLRARHHPMKDQLRWTEELCRPINLHCEHSFINVSCGFSWTATIPFAYEVDTNVCYFLCWPSFFRLFAIVFIWGSLPAGPFSFYTSCLCSLPTPMSVSAPPCVRTSLCSLLPLPVCCVSQRASLPAFFFFLVSIFWIIAFVSWILDLIFFSALLDLFACLDCLPCFDPCLSLYPVSLCVFWHFINIAELMLLCLQWLHWDPETPQIRVFLAHVPTVCSVLVYGLLSMDYFQLWILFVAK